MPEYESSTHTDKSDRITSYALLLLTLIAMTGCHLYFGGGIWLTRLSEYVVALAAAWAIWEFVKYRRHVAMRRRYDGYLPLGSKNLFWQSDRDPHDRGVM